MPEIPNFLSLPALPYFLEMLLLLPLSLLTRGLGVAPRCWELLLCIGAS